MSKRKIELGDVFELETNKGKAYIQYVKEPLSNNELEKVKVFYHLFDETPDDLNDILKGDSFFLSFILKAAYKGGVVEKIGNNKLPDDFEYPKQFRTENPFSDGWNIIDTDENKYIHTGLIELTKEQKNLSPWGTWNDTLLIENLEKGWRLENWI